MMAALYLLIFYSNLPLCLEVEVDFFFDFLSDVTCDDNFAEESACIINFCRSCVFFSRSFLRASI